MIQLIDVSRTYDVGGGLTVLRDVCLTIRRNEYVVILGPSGSGKSTMLHLLGLLDRPSCGALLLDGIDTNTLDDDQLSHLRGHRIGFVFQSLHLIKHLSVLENVELPLFYQRVPPGERRRRAQAQLEQVRLGHRHHHRPNQLSGGEQQRVAIARALVTNPDIMLADEPTGNLDSKSGEDIMALFRELHVSGKTLIVITHDPKVAAQIPRTVLIADGVVTEGARS